MNENKEKSFSILKEFIKKISQKTQSHEKRIDVLSQIINENIVNDISDLQHQTFINEKLISSLSESTVDVIINKSTNSDNYTLKIIKNNII